MHIFVAGRLARSIDRRLIVCVFLCAGFTNVKVACCGRGPYNGIGLCTAASNVCADREVYAFWDPFHPTERANRIIVGQFMHGSTEYMHPMNLSTIIAMDKESP